MRRAVRLRLLVYGLPVLIILLVLVILPALGGGLGWPLRYELAAGYRGWVVIQYEDPACPPLQSKGIYLVIPIPPSGHACTSSPMPKGWRYTRYEYMSPDGTRRAIPWSGWNPDREIWAQSWAPVQRGVSFPRKSFFVGTNAELLKSWGAQPDLRDR